MKIPGVSVIIPMYNAEKYIAECLDSILAQTFQDFEVIVVDDCSTDNSYAIVESYTEKFDGRLKLSKTRKNSGGCGFPRNKGLTFSHGEYISFLDADDAITPTALEELYTLAKNYDADVVACESYYSVPENLWYNTEFRAQLKPFSYQQGGFVDRPTLISDNISERVNEYSQRRFLWNVWSKFIHRDLISENEFLFPENFAIAEDMIFTFCLVCTAKNFLRVPNVVNYYRVLEDSLSHVKKDPIEYFKKYVREWIGGFKYLDEFLSDREFFKQNPQVKYLVLETHLNEMLNYVLKIYGNVPAPFLDEVLRSELGNNMAAFIFNLANVQRLQSIQMQHNFQQFAAQAQNQVNEFNKFAAQAKARIAELENEIKRLKS